MTAGHGATTTHRRRPSAEPLRLVGRAEPTPGAIPGAIPGAQPPIGQPLTQATDPRWVLAVRVAEALEGPILRPEKRERLLRLARVMGLRSFDANLVIAIVQDQARRGHDPANCPAAGEQQLALIPLPVHAKVMSAFRGRRGLGMALAIAGVIAVELLLVRALFF